MSNAPGTIPTFPGAILDAVKEGVVTTFTSICGDPPVYQGEEVAHSEQGVVVGLIGFVGDLNWTLALVLPAETAPVLAERFAGFEIPFDSPDMGDVVGELANVLAGDVRARVEGKKIKTQMSLPSVARSQIREMLQREAPPGARMAFSCNVGLLWCDLVAGKPEDVIRMPG